MRTINCPVIDCPWRAATLRDFTLHLRSSHSHLRNLSVTCPVENCRCVYSTAGSFRVHVSNRHRLEFERGRVKHQPRTSATPPPPNEEGEEHSSSHQETTASASDTFVSALHDLKKQCDVLRLHLEHSYDIPSSTASKIFSDAVQFATSMHQMLNGAVLLRLQELTVDDADLLHYVKCEELESTCTTPIRGSSETLNSMGYVAPQAIDLLHLQKGEEQPPHIGRGRPVMHYVPLLSTLRSYLSHEDVASAVLRERVVSDLSNVTGGSLFREHPLFSVEPHALRLSLYTDELEICNPIGGNNKKHKICCVYFQVGNIGAKHLSSLESVHLAILVKWKYVQRFGHALIFQPLVKDLCILDDPGINVDVRGGGSLHFRGAVFNLCGDNLSVHMLGGFRSVFSSGKVCRFCMADYSELRNLSHEGLCTLRTEASMRQQISLVSADKRMESVYGIVGPSPLSAAPYFRIPQCLPPDAMHDILERMITLNIKVVLRGLNKSNVLRYQTVLALMSDFDYGLVDRVNKHPALPQDLMSLRSTIRGSASQKLHLFYHLSLMIGAHVPDGNKYWKLHLLANRICDLVLAVKVSNDMVVTLSQLVTEHHSLWVKLVPRCYPPKLHYLIHYPRLMLAYSSIRSMWCMRFEAYHLYLKKIARTCNNFINPTATIASRVQKKRCMLFSGATALPPTVKVIGKQQAIFLRNCNASVQAALLRCFPNPDTPLVSVSSVLVNGLLVKGGCYNIYRVMDGDPVFIKVVEAFIVQGEVYAVGELAETCGFYDNIHAFKIRVSRESLVCVMAEKLLPAQSLHAYAINGSYYIKTRFTPVG